MVISIHPHEVCVILNLQALRWSGPLFWVSQLKTVRQQGSLHHSLDEKLTTGPSCHQCLAYTINVSVFWMKGQKISHWSAFSILKCICGVHSFGLCWQIRLGTHECSVCQNCPLEIQQRFLCVPHAVISVDFKTRAWAAGLQESIWCKYTGTHHKCTATVMDCECADCCVNEA